MVHTCSQTHCICEFCNITETFSIDVLLKDLTNHRRCFFVDQILSIWAGFVADGGSCQHFTFISAFPHASQNLLPKVCGVVFRHALQHGFQDDALRRVWNVLGGIAYGDTVAPQSLLISGRIVTISGKTVCFPDDDNLKLVLVSIGYHLLKSGAILCAFPADVWIKVLLNNDNAVVVSVFTTLSNLSLQRLICLIAAIGVSSVDHTTKP